MTKELYVEYNAAIGSLIDARQRYEEACTSQGAESWGAEQAHDYVTREVDHLQEVRARYDAASRRAGRR